jgi:hypothetical protein
VSVVLRWTIVLVLHACTYSMSLRLTCYSRTQRLLRRSRDEATLLKHTLLQLIFGSDVDWSREESLCELVVQLGLRS